jgi:hypothetical protein
MVIEYKKPNAEIRKSYIEMKLSDSGIDINEESVKADIERYVSKTEGYTFDFLKEVIQGIYVDGISEVEVFDRLEDLIKKDGKIRVSEDEAKRIGFSTEYSDNDAVMDKPCYNPKFVEAADPLNTTRKQIRVIKGFDNG